MNKKMADVDINPFGEHESRPDETGGGGGVKVFL